MIKLNTRKWWQYFGKIVARYKFIFPSIVKRKIAYHLFDFGEITLPFQMIKGLNNGNSEYFESKYRQIKSAYDYLNDFSCLYNIVPYIKLNASTNKVLYVCASSMPYHLSGYTVRTHEIVTNLKLLGIDIIPLTKVGYPWSRRDRLKKYCGNATINDHMVYNHIFSLIDSYDNLSDLFSASQEIIDFILSHPVKLVHAASNYMNAIPAFIAAKSLGIPFIYEIRGLWDLTRISRDPWFENTERFNLAMNFEKVLALHADRVVVISEQLANEVISWGTDPNKVHILPNCVNHKKIMNIFKKVDTEKVYFKIGYSGSLVNYEGIDDLFHAIKILLHDKPNIKVIIVGDGVERKKLQILANSLGISTNINFVGRVNQTESLNQLINVDLVVLPRKMEKVCNIIPPLKLVEAMSLGIPLLVPDLDVFKEEIINGVNGYFYTAGNIMSLANKISEIIENYNQAQVIATNARNYVFKHRMWSNELKKIVELYNACTTRSIDNKDISKLNLMSRIGGGEPQIVYKNEINISEVFRQGGITKLQQCIGTHTNSGEWFQIGKVLFDSGYKGVEYELAVNIVKQNSTLANLKGLFWASQRAGEYETSNKVISEIESLMLANQDIYDRGLLDKLKASPAYLLSILKHIKLKDTEKKIIFKTSRVCYVLHNSLPYSSGGYATRSHGVISGLKEAGYDVVVATRPGFPLDIKPELTAEQIPLIDIVDGTEYHRNLAIQRKNLTALSYMQQAADELEKQFVVLQPEIVMAASNHITGIPALIAARRLGIPFIYEVRGLWEITRLSRDAEFESKPAFKIQMLLEAACCKQADYVFTLTTPMKEELINRGVDSDKIEIIPNSCDPCRFIPTKKDIGLASKIGIPLNIPVIGYIGTFVDYEGLEDLAKACGLLKAQGQEFRLLLVGNENASGQDRGPITLEIERIAKECNFIDWLIMPGRVPHEDVESYYSLVDIAVFPRKPLPVCEMVSPMKPLEALAVEKAVLISSVRALAEMIQDGKTGLVFEKGNVFDLAEKLKLLMNDSSLRELLGKAGREWVKSHRTWTQVGNLFYRIVNDFKRKSGE